MQKTAIKKHIIVICVAAAVLASVIAIILFNGYSLKGALRDMDISNKASVERVIKFAKSDSGILCDIAEKYMNAKNYDSGVAILMHVICSEGENDRAVKLLKQYYTEAGADSLFISQFDNAQKIPTDFDVMTELDGVGYGGTDAIYCSDFGGRIKYKLASVRASALYASKGGVYALDIADNCIKLISRDGHSVTNLYEDVSEFVLANDKIYYISSNKELYLPSGKYELQKNYALNLRVEGSDVLCDIYNENDVLQHTLTLND